MTIKAPTASHVLWSILLVFSMVVLGFSEWFLPYFEGTKILVYRLLFPIVFLLFLWWMKGKKTIELPRVGVWMMAAYSLVLVLSGIVSFVPFESFVGVYPRFQGVIQVLSFMILGGVMYVLWDKGVRNRFSRVLTVLGTVVALIALLQPIIGGGIFSVPELYVGRVFGTLGHPTFLGLFMAMVLPFSVYEFYHNCKRNNYKMAFTAYAFPVVTQSVALLASSTRLALIGLMLSVLVTVFLTGTKKVRILASVVLFVLIASVGVLQMFPYTQVKNIPMMNRLHYGNEISMASLASRGYMLQGASEMVFHYPILGVGPDMQGYVMGQALPQKYYEVEDIHTIVDRTHMEILDVALTSGIVAALLLLGFVGWLLFVLLKSIRSVHVPSVLALLTMIFFLFGGIVSTVHYMFFWMLVGILFKEAKVSTIRISGWIVKSKVLVMALVLLISVALVAPGNFQYTQIMHGEVEATEDVFYQGRQTYYGYEVLVHTLNTEKEGSQLLQDLMKHNPIYGDLGILFALDMLSQGQSELALGVFQHIIEREPAVIRHYERMGAALHRTEMYGQAVWVYEHMLPVLPSYVLGDVDSEQHRIFWKNHEEIGYALMFMSQAYLSVGEVNKAREIFYRIPVELKGMEETRTIMDNMEGLPRGEPFAPDMLPVN